MYRQFTFLLHSPLNDTTKIHSALYCALLITALCQRDHLNCFHYNSTDNVYNLFVFISIIVKCFLLFWAIAPEAYIHTCTRTHTHTHSATFPHRKAHKRQSALFILSHGYRNSLTCTRWPSGPASLHPFMLDFLSHRCYSVPWSSSSPGDRLHTHLILSRY